MWINRAAKMRPPANGDEFFRSVHLHPIHFRHFDAHNLQAIHPTNHLGLPALGPSIPRRANPWTDRTRETAW